MSVKISETRKGELLIILESVIWSLFPIITILSGNSLSALYTAAFSLLFATIFFAVTLTLRKKWGDFRKKEAWKYVLLSTFLIGVVYYSLAFYAIQRISAGDAGIIGLMEVFTSFLILGFWKKEKIYTKKVVGAALMVIGALFLLFPGQINLNVGGAILLGAYFATPFGNYFQQKARAQVGSDFLMFVRSLLSGIFIFFLALFFEPKLNFEDVKTAMPFLAINGLLLLGFSKVLWIEGIHRISITKAVSLNTMMPAFTLIFAYFILDEIPTWWQLLGFIPIFFGARILLKKDFSRRG